MDEQLSAGDDGATAVEYALMLSLIFLAVISAVTLLGVRLASAYGNAAALL